MNKKLKGMLSLLLRIFLSLGFLIYLYFQIDIDKTITILKSANLLYVFYNFLIYIFIMVVLLISRWWILVRALGLKAPWVSIVRYHFIGLFGNIILPTAIGGDVVKVLGLCTHSSEKPKVVGSVILDRLSGFAGMIVVATAAFIIGYTLIPDFSLGFSILILTILSVMATVVLFNERLYTFCCRIFTPFPKIKKGLMRMHYDIKLIMDHKGALVMAMLLSCLAQVILAFGFYLLAKALHQDIAFIYFLVFVPLISVTSSLPSIGGLGVREAGAVFLFAKVGMSQGVALSISLMGYISGVIIGLAGGLVFMMTHQVNLKQWKEAAAALEENEE
jgi:uncharacterized protein (TIRG00374 family)